LKPARIRAMMRRGELSMNPPEATGQVAEQVPHWMQVLIGLPFEAYSKWLISSTKDIGFSGGTALGAAGSATAVAVLICFWPFAFRQS